MITSFIAFVFLFFFTCSVIKNKFLRSILALTTSAFLSVQAFSLYATRTFIGYQFYLHTNIIDVQGMQLLFVKEIVIFSSIFVALLMIFIFSYQWLNLLVEKNISISRFFTKWFRVLYLIVALIVIVVNGKFWNDSKTLITMMTVEKESDGDFSQTLQLYGMADYILPEQIDCRSDDKNVIVISMESLEKAFLNSPDSLTPNLNRLKNSWTYLDLYQNEGSSWTSGSLYTSLTGFPAFFRALDNNHIFQTAYKSNISTIADVFNKMGYTTIFLNGNCDFSGTKQMLHLFKFDKIIDFRSVSSGYPQSHFGLYDKDIFALAQKEIEVQNRENKPFFMFISTTDTHFPDGMHDDRMEQFVAPQKSGLYFAIKALDVLIGEFYSFLQKSNTLDKSTIFIYPDHLKMGTPPTCDNNSEQRKLYLITNSKTITTTQEPIYQIDIPKLILQGANIIHNIRFLTDYIDGDKGLWIRENIVKIANINSEGFVRLVDKDEIDKINIVIEP